MFTKDLLIMGLIGAGARLLDVPLSVLKTTFIVNGKRGLASIAAFFKVLVYMLAAAPVFKNVDKPLVLILFCVGRSLQKGELQVCICFILPFNRTYSKYY